MFGVWGMTSKLAVDAAGWKLMFVTAQMTSAAVGLSMLVATRPRLMWGELRWAVATGFLGMLGVLAFSIALERAPASRIIPITAMYPAITVLLSWLILGERLTGRHIAGVVFALVGLALLG
jgi:transporter family protein